MNPSWAYYSMDTSYMVYLCDDRKTSIQTRPCETNACVESSEQFSFSFYIDLAVLAATSKSLNAIVMYSSRETVSRIVASLFALALMTFSK